MKKSNNYNKWDVMTDYCTEIIQFTYRNKTQRDFKNAEFYKKPLLEMIDLMHRYPNNYLRWSSTNDMVIICNKFANKITKNIDKFTDFKNEKWFGTDTNLIKNIIKQYISALSQNNSDDIMSQLEKLNKELTIYNKGELGHSFRTWIKNLDKKINYIKQDIKQELGNDTSNILDYLLKSEKINNLFLKIDQLYNEEKHLDCLVLIQKFLKGQDDNFHNHQEPIWKLEYFQLIKSINKKFIKNIKKNISFCDHEPKCAIVFKEVTIFQLMERHNSQKIFDVNIKHLGEIPKVSLNYNRNECIAKQAITAFADIFKAILK